MSCPKDAPPAPEKQLPQNVQTYRIGIDIGGTFTDFVIFHPHSGVIDTFKLPSTPQNPAQAVIAGLRPLIHPSTTLNIIHGSTVATNALLERKGARTALITTRGFRDVIQIGRQNRPVLYDLTPSLPPPLVPDHLRLEVDERVDYQGRVLIPLNVEQAESLIPILQEQEVESVAICLLFSFQHPKHERLIREKCQSAGYFVSASHDILPQFREYERASTTTVNAYVAPVMDTYLTHLEVELGNSPGAKVNLRIMGSNGGSMRLDEARQRAVRCVISGPAGGVIGAQAVARLAGITALMSFDMGGTSTDVSLVTGAPKITTESEISGVPISIPMLDIHTVGAGGGSIARLDAGGALRVGPESAGAHPGPACYGQGELPTVTDANLVLGRLVSEYFLGGKMVLHPERAWRALSSLGDSLGLSAEQVALGIVQVVNAHMARALRVISVERGHDPREFTLVSFGGAGGLHAADLARDLGIPHVLIPPHAATLSALGMLMADVIKERAHTIMLPGNTTCDVLERLFQPVAEALVQDVLADGVPPTAIQTMPLLDVRYRGQSYELTVPFDEQWKEAFHRAHQEAYGSHQPDAEIEIVNFRARVIGVLAKPELTPSPMTNPDPSPAFIERRPVTLSTGPQQVACYAGEQLQPGVHLTGPALILRPDTTILIHPPDKATVDPYHNLLIEVGPYAPE
ncbi:MAG: hydantoinase/oxoprolinase family protein [Chloroflexota bacterium]